MAAFAASASATATSSAYDASATLTVGSSPTVSLADINLVSGTSPASYSLSNTVVGVTNTQTLGVYRIDVGARTLISSASSAYPTPPSATATATIQNFSASLSELVAGAVIPLISITADEISSTSSVGTGGAVGSTTISNVVVVENPSFGPLGTRTLSIPSPIPVNDVVFNIDGAEMIINAQTAIPGGIATDAVELLLTNASYAGSTPVSGDVVIGHSQASIATPEPSTWATMMSGLAALGMVARRRRLAAAR